jgi:lysophospholipase L1-like esterase
MIQPRDVILFQGDSITNAFRKPEEVSNAYQLGAGYALMAAAQLLLDRPGDELSFHNRGVSGDTLDRMAARWETDCLALKPTIVSILVGVNDTLNLHPVDTFLDRYRALLERTRAALPGARFILGEPFLLPCGTITTAHLTNMAQRQPLVRQLAREFGARFVPYAAAFADAQKKAPPAYWAFDGIHPTAPGFALMARLWLQAVG